MGRIGGKSRTDSKGNYTSGQYKGATVTQVRGWRKSAKRQNLRGGAKKRYPANQAALQRNLKARGATKAGILKGLRPGSGGMVRNAIGKKGVLPNIARNLVLNRREGRAGMGAAGRRHTKTVEGRTSKGQFKKKESR